MNFGDNVRTLREKKGITQAELSAMVGVSQPTFAQYETGSKAPNVYTAVKLARILGATVEELVPSDTEEQAAKE